jgi:NAD+ kinase
MKIAIVGLDKQRLTDYVRKHHRRDFVIVKTKPEFVLCYGGDGTLLYAEQHYPCVPKVMIRQNRVCRSCAESNRITILQLLARGHYSLLEQPLLETKIHGQTLYGMNDILVSHGQMNTGLRYRLYLNGQNYGGALLGDGIIVSTPLGSTGYFQSVTRSTFQQGLGVALNNTIFMINHVIAPAETVVKVIIDRGPALVTADNAKAVVILKAGETVLVKQSHRSTYIVYFAGKEYRKYNLGIGETRVALGFCQVCGEPLPV